MKIVQIKSCYKCPYRERRWMVSYCLHRNGYYGAEGTPLPIRVSAEALTIPAWCPLPDGDES